MIDAGGGLAHRFPDNSACRRRKRDSGRIPLDQRRSDSDFVSADTRAMQNDDTANPGMLAVLDGETLWNEKAGATNKSCADCHGDAAVSMKGVASRYPAFAANLAVRSISNSGST